ncbi:MAG: cytidine deaminase [Thermoanaerobaculia bacterium]
MRSWDQLIAAAADVRARAYAPYSSFRVGAALRTADGAVFTGCNVENRSFGLALCAERAALAAMVAAGRREPEALVVVTGIDPPAAPCGLCREALAEFAPDLPILLVSEQGTRREVRLAELLPDRFQLPPSTQRG